MHSQNIIHRDIKPENLVIDKAGYLKLTDLGISARLDERGLCERGSGTQGYTAPEIMCAPNREHGKASDIFAFGIWLYEMMHKKRPWKGNPAEFKQHYPKDSKENSQDAHKSDEEVSASSAAVTIDYEAYKGTPFYPAVSAGSEAYKQLCLQSLMLSPRQRMLGKETDSLKSHEFFKGFDWGALNAR